MVAAGLMRGQWLWSMVAKDTWLRWRTARLEHVHDEVHGGGWSCILGGFVVA